MNNPNRKAHPFIGVLGTLYGIYLLYGIGSSMMDRYTVAQLTDHVRTACVGRFLIDLPASMEYSYGQVFLDGLWISGREETREDFTARLLARKAEIDAEPNQFGQKNLESFEDYDNHGFEGKILIFSRSVTKGLSSQEKFTVNSVPKLFIRDRISSKPQPARPGLNEVLRLIAQRGGFLARKRDGEPGVKVIGKGLTKIRLVAVALREMNSAYERSRVVYKGLA